MAEKRPKAGLSLRNVSTNIPTKKIKEDAKKHHTSNDSTLQKPLPAQKTSLVYKFNDRFTTNEGAFPLEELLYKEGYQKDYIRFLLKDEKRYILKRNFLQSTTFTLTSRYAIVNFLLRMQKYFRIPDNEYYMAVKLMDYSSQICSDPGECILLAITSLWLVHKYFDNSVLISPNSILKFLRSEEPATSEKYRVEDILKMERSVLMFTKFMVKLPDPSIYIEHFLRKLKLMSNKHLYHGSYFVCDCISTFPKFSYVETSLVAAIALYTTLVIMKEDTSQFLQMTQNVFQEENLKTNCMDTISKLLFIHKIAEYREPFVKYSTMERLNISFIFEKYLMSVK